MVDNSSFQEVEIPYSNSKLILNIPDQTEITILKPNEKVTTEDFNFESRISEILQNSIWNELQKSLVLIVVNDATRATPTEVLLDKLIPFFNDKGWIVGLVLAFFVALVILGGIKSIAKVTARIVPIMAIIYIL